MTPILLLKAKKKDLYAKRIHIRVYKWVFIEVYGRGVTGSRMKNYKPFSRLNLKKLRLEYNLKQKDVASILGVSVVAVKAWEQGRRNMKVKTWDELLKIVEF